MQHILLTTSIAAPLERCFLLSLNIDLHKASTAGTAEQAIAGVTHGLIGPNQTVTWRARHFGFMLTHQSVISRYDMPTHFRDEMTQGMFKSFEHDHFFETLPGNKTSMRDELTFRAPLGPLGLMAEYLVLRSYLRRFLIVRNRLICETAEADESVWMPYVTGISIG